MARHKWRYSEDRPAHPSVEYARTGWFDCRRCGILTPRPLHPVIVLTRCSWWDRAAWLLAKWHARSWGR